MRAVGLPGAEHAASRWSWAHSSPQQPARAGSSDVTELPAHPLSEELPQPAGNAELLGLWLRSCISQGRAPRNNFSCLP